MKVWKVHISEDFEKNPFLLANNGVGIGGTVFLNYYKMLSYFIKDYRRWHVAEIDMEEHELKKINSDFMATSLVNKISKNGFKPLIKSKQNNQ